MRKMMVLALTLVAAVAAAAPRAQEPTTKAGCFGSYGTCECYKISGSSGCLTSGSGSDCSRCCTNLHC